MKTRRFALPAALLALALLAACQTDSIPIEALATEVAFDQVTPTFEPSATPTTVPTPTATPLPTIDLEDGANDCVTSASLPIDCSTIQRDVTDLSLVSDGRTLTITVTIDGQPWEQFPAQYVSFQFDTDSDVATGSRTLGIQHGMGTDTNVFWGWTTVAVPFGVETYDQLGDLTGSSGERADYVTIVDDQTLQLEISLAEIGSDRFNFVFSLQAPPGVGIFDTVPEPGQALSFPSGELTGESP